MQQQAQLYVTYLNVLVSVSMLDVFVLLVLRSVMVKLSIPVVSHSTNTSKLRLSVVLKVAYVAVLQQYSTHYGTAKFSLYLY